MTVQWSLDAELARRPRIRVNQLGYLPDGPKQAVVVTDATAPVRFEVHDGVGRTAHVGVSTPWPVRPDPSSGMGVHQIDFRAVNATGDGYRVVADRVASHPFTIRADLYGPLAADALRFFTLQRSGIAIDDLTAPGYGRPAGHVGVPPNRGDTRVRAWTGPDAERLYPGWTCDGEFDVAGGWYDAGRLLDAARVAYQAAREHPTLLAPDDHGAFGGGPYSDDELDDEFYWAAVELFLATDERPFLDDLERSPCHHADVFEPDGFDWDRVAVPARLDLATTECRLTDRPRVQQSVIGGADRIIEIQRTQPWAQPYAPADGWDWGSNGRILNSLVVLATAYDLTGRRDYLDATLTGMDFVLGLNALGQSFITGYGTDHTCHQRTRHFAHDLDPAFPPPPPGAIAGGPNSKTYQGFPSDDRLRGLPPQLCYLDEPTSETTNDVCIRWNAPLVWVALFLDEHQGGPDSVPIDGQPP